MSQSNDNANTVNEEDRFKFVDDLTVLEIINLLLMEISSYDLYAHVPSDIPTHNNYIRKENLKSQENLSLINVWTKKKTMILNQKKTKNMIFNFSKNHQFQIRLNENKENIDVVDTFKLLGTIITNDLKWNTEKKNTEYLTKKAWKRMQLLNNAAQFTSQIIDLESIYTTFIRPVLEQSSPVWSSSLTEENSTDIERVQKTAIKIIMGKKYNCYKSALLELNLKTLSQRRIDLSLVFAKRTIQNKKVKKMFPIRQENRFQKRRKTEYYKVNRASTERLKMSAIPQMQHLLNEEHTKKNNKTAH